MYKKMILKRLVADLKNLQYKCSEYSCGFFLFSNETPCDIPKEYLPKSDDKNINIAIQVGEGNLFWNLIKYDYLDMIIFIDHNRILHQHAKFLLKTLRNSQGSGEFIQQYKVDLCNEFKLNFNSREELKRKMLKKFDIDMDFESFKKLKQNANRVEFVHFCADLTETEKAIRPISEAIYKYDKEIKTDLTWLNLTNVIEHINRNEDAQLIRMRLQKSINLLFKKGKHQFCKPFIIFSSILETSMSGFFQKITHKLSVEHISQTINKQMEKQMKECCQNEPFTLFRDTKEVQTKNTKIEDKNYSDNRSKSRVSF